MQLLDSGPIKIVDCQNNAIWYFNLRVGRKSDHDEEQAVEVCEKVLLDQRD